MITPFQAVTGLIPLAGAASATFGWLLREYTHPSAAKATPAEPITGLRELLMSIPSEFQTELARFDDAVSKIETFVGHHVEAALVVAKTDAEAVAAAVVQDKNELLAAIQARLAALEAKLVPPTA